MKTLKVTLLVSRSGEDGSHAPGDVIEVSEMEAISLINNGSAEAKDKKAYASAIDRIEKEKIEEAEKSAQLNAILLKDTLMAELRDLYAQIARKTAQIEGVILTDEEIEAFVEKSMNGEDPSGNENQQDNQSSELTGGNEAGNGTDNETPSEDQ